MRKFHLQQLKRNKNQSLIAIYPDVKIHTAIPAFLIANGSPINAEPMNALKTFEKSVNC